MGKKLKMLYTVALVQDKNDSSLKALHWHINTVKEDNELRLLDIQDQLDMYGDYKCLFYMQTRSREAMLSARIKCECAELRDVVRRHNDLLTFHNGSPVLNQTYDLCCEVQNVHINHIGRLVRRLVTRSNEGKARFEREIKDEIAIQCYDLICKQDEAKRAYEKMDRKLNERYHRSQMNAYC